MKELNFQKQMKIDLKERVKEEIKSLSSKIPDYEELSLMEKAMVEKYIEQIDLSNPETINKLGGKTPDDIHQELNELLDMIQKHNTDAENMFVEIMVKIDENTKLRKTSEKSFIQQFKETPLAAFAKFKSTSKKTTIGDKRTEILKSIEELKTKVEEIRDEAKSNTKTLEKMLQNLKEEYSNIQCQIIALEIIKGQINNGQKERKSEQKNFNQIEEKLQLLALEERIERKIEECKNASINVADKAIMIRLLIQQNEKCISKYDEDLLVSIPKLTQNVIISEANDSLTQDIEICDVVTEKLSTKNIISREEEKNETEKTNEDILKVATSNV